MTVSANGSNCQCLPAYYLTLTANCISCMSGCLNCSLLNNTEKCSLCDILNNWSIDSNNLTCSCITAYYLTSSLTCLPCFTGCLSCYLNNSIICTSCDSSLHLVMGNGNLTCDCAPAYYYNNSCTACQTQAIGCLTCSYTSSSFTCNTCDGSLTRILSNDNTNCPC
jgi:hypothetical protein